MISNDTKYFLKLVVLFCVIGFTVTISTTQLNILIYGSPIFMVFYAISGYSPAFSGIISAKKFLSKDEFNNFIKSCINIKRSPKEYFYTILVTLLLWCVPFVVVEFFRGNDALLKSPLIFLSWLTPVMIFGGGLEEIGWRGFLLPRLLKRYSPTKSSLIIGVIWSLWHLPLWFVVGTSQQDTGFIAFALSCIAASFILTYIYMETESIWLCILFHALTNACSYVFKYSVDVHIIIALFTCIACYFIFYFSNKYITLKSK